MKKALVHKFALVAVAMLTLGASAELCGPDVCRSWATKVTVRRGQEHVFWITENLPVSVDGRVYPEGGYDLWVEGWYRYKEDGEYWEDYIVPSEWIDIYDGNGVPLGIYARLTIDDWEWVPNTVNSVSFRVEVEGPYDGKNYFSFGHASSASAVYEPTNSVTTVDGLEVKYRANIWGSTALVTDRQSVTLNIGGQSQRYCGIPRTVNGLEVKGITSSTFSMKDEITALQLPFQVTSANAGTLGDFSHLQSISVVDDYGKVVQELICVDGAFYSTDKTTLYFVTAAATALTIPATVTQIVANAFQNAADLTSVTIDPANPSFKVVNDMICTFDETKIISALPYMTELRFPEAAIEADWASFAICNSLSSFHYNNSSLCREPLNNVGFPYDKLQKITTVTIDDSVTEIGDHAFEGFSGLRGVQIPASVKRIGAYAFSGCSIGMLTVPQSVEELGVYFYNGGILRLECPLCYFTDESENVPYDPFDPMWLSTVLDPCNTYIICSEEVADEWNDAIYYGGFNLPGQSYSWNVGDWNVNGRIDDGGVVVDDLYYNGAMAWDGTETLSIPDSVGPFPIVEVRNLGIGGALANLVFPASLKSGGGCLNSVIWSGTKTITFEAGVPDGFTECLFELFNNEVTVRYPDVFADEWSLFVDENGKVKFAEQPYADVGDLRYRLSWKGGAWSIIEVCFVPGLQEEPPHPTALTLPTTLFGHPVKGIDGELIGGCVLGCLADSLREVVIPAGYERIGMFAFQSLYNLKSVSIPEGVTFIGSSAFSDCHGIECLTIPASVVKMGCNVFDGAILRFECNCPAFVQDDGMPVDNQYLGWLSSVLGTETYIDCADEVFESWRDAIFYGGFNQFGQGYAVYDDERSVDFQISDREVYITQLSYNMMMWDGTETLVLPERIGPFPVCGISGVGVGAIAGAEFPTSLREISSSDLDNIAGSISNGAMTFRGGVPFGFAEATGLRGKLVNYPEEFAAEWSVFVDDKGRAKFSGLPYEIVAGVKYTFACGDGGATIVFAEPLSSIPAVLRIPDKLLGLPVKGIGESAFTQGYGFEDACTSVAIPESVETIGRSAFAGFSRMTTLVLPASVSVVKGGAFYGCSALRTLTLANPEVITYDRETCEPAFDSSTMPNMVVAARVPDGISTENLRTVKVPDGTTAIPFGAFAGCKFLSVLTLPDSLVTISKCAFSGCESLGRVNVPRGVKDIEDGVFSFCFNLSDVTLPVKLEKIGKGLFLFCRSLSHIEIPTNVKAIGDYAFLGCAANSFVIPASVVTVGRNVFSSYRRNSLYVRSLCEVSFPMSEVPLLVFKGSKPEGFDLMLPNGVNMAELIDFEVRQSLSELTLLIDGRPEDRVSECLNSEIDAICGQFQDYDFDMLSLTETYIAHTDADDASWDDITAFGYNPYGCSRSLSFEDGYGYFEFVVTDGGVEIVGGEFYDEFTVGDDGVMSSVSTVPSTILTLPVVRIGESAFEGSWRDFPEWGVRPRMSIVLPYTLREVGDFAFADCNWLSDIVIPEGVGEIGWAAFAGCTELRKVTLPSTLAFVGDEAFEGCTKLRDVGFSPKGMTALGVGAFAECSSLVDVSLYGVDVIGDAAFEGCESLQRVMFDAVLSSLGVDAFNACFKLQQLVFNGDVPAGLHLAGYPTGTRIDYPSQYAENWQRALGADSVSCAVRAPGLLSVTTRIAANVAENAPVAKDVTLLGSEETINRALDLNISPRVIDEGSGSVNLEYKDPHLTIVDFKPTEGLILVRVEPEEGCEIVGKVPLERVRLIGYDDLSNMTHGKFVPIQIDDSEYLTQGTQGLLTLRFDATLANFFTASIVDVAVQGE